MANPPRGDSYDGAYWDPSPGEPRLTSIRQHFADLGYAVKVGPWPMNELGPKGTGTIWKNESGTTGKTGGYDDKPSAVVKKFQSDYNAVSKAKNFVSGMGSLDEDGIVGYYTLNGLRYVTESLGGKHWPDIVKEAGMKGFSPTVAKAAIPTLPGPGVAKPAFPTIPPPSGGERGGEGQTAGKKKSSALPLVAGAAVLLLVMAKK